MAGIRMRPIASFVKPGIGRFMTSGSCQASTPSWYAAWVSAVDAPAPPITTAQRPIDPVALLAERRGEIERRPPSPCAEPASREEP